MAAKDFFNFFRASENEGRGEKWKAEAPELRPT
jgi:hypothetical protein